jgi:hypothetical protein
MRWPAITGGVMSEQDSDRTRYVHGGPGPRRTVATLVVVGPEDQAGRSVAVGPSGINLGRDATCDLVLPSDQVSRRHAAVRPYGDGFLVEDLDSLNGTSLNDRPFTGAVVLRDGDRLHLADVEVEFRLAESRNVPPLRSQPRPGARWRPDAPTQPTGQVEPPTPPEEKPSLRRELHDAPGFSGTALLLTIAGSLVGTILVGYAEVGPWGSLAGAAVAPVVTATFTTKRTGEKGRVRALAIVILSAAALAITVTGVSAAEVVTDGRMTPGLDSALTFPLPNPDNTDDPGPTPTEDTSPPTSPTDGTNPTGPAIAVPSTVDCGTAPLSTTVTCEPVTIESIGTEDLEIGEIEWVENSGEFEADFSGCENQTIPPGESCQFTVDFTPQEAGDRSAVLVIHQNLPPPDTGTPVAFAGVGS